MRIWSARDLEDKGAFFEVLATTRKTQFASMVLQPGQESGEYGNDHAHADQWLVVLEGEGEARIEGETKRIGPGDVVLVAAPDKHQFRCTGDRPLKTITFYGPVAYPDEG